MNTTEINNNPATEQLALMASLLQETNGHFFFQHKLASGEIRDVESYTTSLQLEGHTRVLKIIHDISDRVRAEKENKAAQEQLIHSSRLASIGTLASGIAHEINNPLAILSNYVAEIEERSIPIDKERLNFIAAKMKNAIERAAKIVAGLRAYARPISTEVEELNIHAIIAQTIELVTNSYGKLGVEILIEAENDKCAFLGSAGKMQQVLLNLLENGVHAVENNPENMRKLAIRTNSNNEHIFIEINDNGCGINPEHLSSIFNPFFTTKGPGKGTGLGLSISQSIIAAMNGTLSVITKQGAGTTLTIKVPKIPTQA
jgi:two-component system C4-dicarboxylate transport sensor histidine kinase DctB